MHSAQPQWRRTVILASIGLSLSASLYFAGCSPADSNRNDVSARQQAQVASWAPNVSYSVGEQIEYGGRLYTVIQAHTSLVGWEPSNVPALWRDDGPISVVDPTTSLPMDPVFPASCDEDPSVCCPNGVEPTVLSASHDTLAISDQTACVAALDGNDTLTVQTLAPATILAGAGDDTVFGGPGADLLVGGPGRDTLYGYDGNNALYGGPGDDVIFAGNGTNHVYPGAGIDTVSTGTGDDTIYILDLCEITAGEQIAAGTGFDTVISPVPEAELLALGIVLSGVEQVVVENNSCRSECSNRPSCADTQECSGGLGVGEMICRDKTNGAAAESLTARIYFPRGTTIEDALISSRYDLTVQPNAILGLENGLFTSGQGAVVVSDGAVVPGLRAVRNLTIGAGSTVQGEATAGGSIEADSSASILGQVQENAAIVPPDAYSAEFLFQPPFEGNYLIQTGVSRVLWPGSYGDVTVENGARIYLSAGDYSFRNLDLKEGSFVQVNSREGWAEVIVRESTSLAGTVSALGEHDVQLSVVQAGSDPLNVAGAFQGVVIAPSAPVTIQAGTHSMRVYGAQVTVNADASLNSPVVGWGPTLPYFKAPEVTKPLFSRKQMKRPSIASSTAVTTVSDGERIQVPVVERIPVISGNAGQGTVDIEITDGSAVIHCSYEGRSAVPHPTSVLELAQGSDYWFVQCDNGASVGDVLEGDSYSLTVVGDDQQIDETSISIPSSTCNNILPTPIPLGESRQMAEEYEWPQPWLHVADEYDGTPALYYANFYITNKAQLDMLDAMLIHWSEMPLFGDEWPTDWDSLCGTIHFDHDGEGMWVFAVLPGAIYNILLDAHYNLVIEPTERENIPLMRLREIPAELQSSIGSFDLSKLDQLGFRYLNLDELPDDAAINAILEGKGAAKVIKGLLQFVGNVVRTSARALRIFWGFLDKAYGTVHVDLDVDVMNVDDRFVDPNTEEPTRMTRAWMSGKKEMALGRVRVSIYNYAHRWTDPLTGRPPTVAVEYRGQMNTRGEVRIGVGRDRPGVQDGEVGHKKTCITLNNEQAMITSFVTPSKFCYKDLGDQDFNHFDEDSSIKLPLEHWHLANMAEATDAHTYVATVIGVDLKKANITVGKTADIFDGKDNRIYCPAFSYANSLTDIPAGIAVIAHYFGIPAEAIGTFVSAGLSTDIFVGPKSEARNTRGLMSHEYGHFTLVGLLHEAGDGYVDRHMLTWDTIDVGPGELDPNDDVRVINEAFADFIAGQVASSSDYFSPNGSDREDLDDGILSHYSQHLAAMTRAPGLDENWFEKATVGEAIGRLTTLLHDIVDGRSLGSLGPNSGAYWAYSSTDGKVRSSEDIPLRSTLLSIGGPLTLTDIAERDPREIDGDPYVLSGPKILQLARAFVEARDSGEKENGTKYTVTAMERAIGKTAVTEQGWCDACELLLPHFERVTSSDTRDDLWNRCLQNSRVGLALGTPPVGPELIGSFCSSCPPFTGFDQTTGKCEPCPTDRIFDWNLDGGVCTDVDLDDSTPATGDFCPNVLTVDLVNVPDGTDLKLDWDVAGNVQSSEAFCTAAHVQHRVSKVLSTGSLATFSSGASNAIWNETCGQGLCLDACFVQPHSFNLGDIPLETGNARLELQGEGTDLLEVGITTSCGTPL